MTVFAKPRPAEQPAVENARHRGVQHAVGVVRAMVMASADRIPELPGARTAPPARRMNRSHPSGGHPASTKGLTNMHSPIIGLALAASVSLAAGVATQAAAQPTQLLPPMTRTGTTTPIAPAVTVYADTDARGFLLSARSAVERGRTTEAREALEQAETRLLGRAAPPLPSGEPANPQSVQLIVAARRALTANDRPAALRAIDDALTATAVAARPQPLPPLAGAAPVPAPVIPPPPPVPTITRALLAGHWALDGADWKWVPPETVLRPVQTAPRVAGQYVWRDQRYVWVPAHYAD